MNYIEPGISPIVPRSADRATWDAEVIYHVEMRLDASTSDAQGIVALHLPLSDRAFEEGLAPEAAAALIATDAASEQR